ncbi:MAG: alpha/beta hydrolase [Myxococcota bacterium]
MEKNVLTLPGGLSLSYIEGGSGHPLVMLPGWSQTASGFAAQFGAFSKVARVIAVDHRGHGDSENAPAGYRIQRLARDLDEFLAVMGLGSFDLLGHSMGCSVIWSYMSMFGRARAPRKIVLADQAPAVVAQADWTEQQIADAGCLFPSFDALNGFEQAVRGAETPDAHKELIRGMFSAETHDGVLNQIASENLKLPRAHAAHLLHDHCVLDWRTEIQQIRVPTLVIGGEASIFSAQSQRWIASQIPGAQVEIFEADQGGSHFMFVNNPERFNARVAAFLSA